MAALTAAAIALAGASIYSAYKSGKNQQSFAPPTIPPPPTPARLSDPGRAIALQRRRKALDSMPHNTRSGTLLTGPQGVTTPVAAQGKTLLGQ